jgi:hypothetical protein
MHTGIIVSIQVNTEKRRPDTDLHTDNKSAERILSLAVIGKVRACTSSVNRQVHDCEQSAHGFWRLVGDLLGGNRIILTNSFAATGFTICMPKL